MSAMLPAYIFQFADPGLTMLLGALATTLLVILLVGREMLRMYGKPFAHRTRVLNIVTYPLMLVFAIIVIEEFYRLIFL
jgi:hypothetical protein